jgi:DNA invertase Pin-like site-specific DNA recombinase
MISRRTKDALAVAKARGVALGGHREQSDENRQKALARAAALRPVFAELSGLSARKAAAELNTRGVATPQGGKWHAAQVIRVRERLA